MMSPRDRALAATLILTLAACTATTSGATPSHTPLAASPASPTAPSFPVEAFARLSNHPVSHELGAELQAVLDRSAHGAGLTAAVISSNGTWAGATGFAAAGREMVPNDQMSIAHITQTVVAAQVMQLAEAGRLDLDDLAADLLPRDLSFDTNGATIADLLSHRSGLADSLSRAQWKSLTTDPLHAWTPEEVLPTVGPHTAPGREWEFVGTNYLLLGLIVEHVTGRSLAKVLRHGVLQGGQYDRLIFQPDERPTAPMAMASGGPATAFEQNGGSLPSIARVTAERGEANMASDAPTLARWFEAFCAGQVVSQASLDEMTNFDQRPEFGLGIWDRRYQYGSASGALGLAGVVDEGYRSAGFCFQDPVAVVVVLANDAKFDVETAGGRLVDAVSG